MTSVRRPMVEDLARHLAEQCTDTLTRHMRVMAASSTSSREAMMIITAGAAQFLLNALRLSVAVSVTPGQEAALFEQLLQACFNQIREAAPDIVADINKARTP